MNDPIQLAAAQVWRPAAASAKPRKIVWVDADHRLTMMGWRHQTPKWMGYVSGQHYQQTAEIRLFLAWIRRTQAELVEGGDV